MEKKIFILLFMFSCSPQDNSIRNNSLEPKESLQGGSSLPQKDLINDSRKINNKEIVQQCEEKRQLHAQDLVGKFSSNYEKNCAICHGKNGLGENLTGSNLTLSHLDLEQFKETVYDNPPLGMQKFTKNQYSEADAELDFTVIEQFNKENNCNIRVLATTPSNSPDEIKIDDQQVVTRDRNFNTVFEPLADVPFKGEGPTDMRAPLLDLNNSCATIDTSKKSTVNSNQLSSAFHTTCAGCHGEKGGGRDVFPPARETKLSLEEYKKIVRAGSKSTILHIDQNYKENTKEIVMPAFLTNKYSDKDLEEDYNKLHSKDLLAKIIASDSKTVSCGTILGDYLTETEMNTAIEEGLAAWRTTQKDAACFMCHGADPIDLARIGYTDGDIMRRALLHLDEPTSKKIVKYVHAYRKKHNIDRLFDPEKFRPMQPAGDSLAGENNARRDINFMKMLIKNDVIFAKKKINSTEEMTKAIKQMGKIDLYRLRLPIFMNRYTADGIRGDDFHTTAEWIPNFPHRPISKEWEQKIYAAADAYIAEPSAHNHWTYYHTLREGSRLDEDGISDGGGALEKLAEKSLLCGAKLPLHAAQRHRLHSPCLGIPSHGSDRIQWRLS